MGWRRASGLSRSRTLAALLGEQATGEPQARPRVRCMLVEQQLPGLFVVMRIARQRQVVRGCAGAIEAEALDRLGDAVGNRQRVAEDAAVLSRAAPGAVPSPERTDEGGRVAPIEADRIEAQRRRCSPPAPHGCPVRRAARCAGHWRSSRQRRPCNPLLATSAESSRCRVVPRRHHRRGTPPGSRRAAACARTAIPKPR